MNTSTQDTPTAPVYAIVELFGHTRIAGQLSEHMLAGSAFVRIDVPAIGDQPSFTKLFGASAIYGISFVAEPIATAMAAQLRAAPVGTYELPALQRATQRIAPMDPEEPDPAF